MYRLAGNLQERVISQSMKTTMLRFRLRKQQRSEKQFFTLHLKLQKEKWQATETVTAKGADGLDATFKLGTDFNLPAGYKLSNDREQATEITIPFGSTGGHTMVVEKGDLSSIVKIQLVDAENNDEVVAGGDYFVDGDGDGIFNTSEITEWVPEGYELQEVGAF